MVSRNSTEESDQQKKPVIIGVSFGSMYACISIPTMDDKVRMTIANEDGERQIPTVVAFNEHEELFGSLAKNQAMSNPRRTLFQFQNLLGRKMEDDEVAQYNSSNPFTRLVPSEKDETTPCFEIEWEATEGQEDGRKEQFTVTQITAKYLSKIKSTAEYFLGSNVDGVVLSVPVHFDRLALQELKLASKEAGFSFTFCVREPVAALMAYEGASLNSREAAEKMPDQQILVLDLGAHAFNLTLLSIHDGVFTIEENTEDFSLGGIQFDQVIFDLVSQEFFRKFKLDVNENRRSKKKLLTACEKTKRALTRQETAPCSVESLMDGMDYHGSIHRARFEINAGPLFQRAKDLVNALLAKTKLTPGQIHEVFLVGGAARIPKFQAAMRSIFESSPSTLFRMDLDPDEAISLGCAIQAEMMLGSSSTALSLYQDNKLLDKLTMASRLSKGLGIAGADGKIRTVIPEGTPLPVRRNLSFKLPTPTEQVYVALYEKGHSGTVKDSRLIVDALLEELLLKGDDEQNRETIVPTSEKPQVVSLEITIEEDSSTVFSVSESLSGQKLKIKTHPVQH